MKNSLKIVAASVSLIVVLVCSGLAVNYLAGLKSPSLLQVTAGSSETKMLNEEGYELGEKYESPVYFTIFKFISNYLPFKDSES